MKTKKTSSNFSTFTLLGLVLIVVLLGGLGEIWFRVQIHRTAERIQQTDLQASDLNRRLQLVEARIAEARRPDVLLERVGGRLVRPTEGKVVWVSDPDEFEIAVSPGIGVAGGSWSETRNVP